MSPPKIFAPRRKIDGGEESDYERNLGGARARAAYVLGRVRVSTELSDLASTCSYGTHSIPRSILAAGRRELASLCENSVTDRVIFPVLEMWRASAVKLESLYSDQYYRAIDIY